MMPHPTGAHAVAELHRRDLLALAERERLAMTALGQTPRTITVVTLRALIASAGRMLQPIFGWGLETGVLLRHRELPAKA